MVQLTQYLFALFAVLSLFLGAAASPFEATTTTYKSPRKNASDGPVKREDLKRGTVCASIPIVIEAVIKTGTPQYVSRRRCP